MRIFLDDPEGTVRRLVTTQYRVPADKLLRCSEQSEIETASAGLAHVSTFLTVFRNCAYCLSLNEHRVNGDCL